MIAISGAIICFAYILGLLLTGLTGKILGMPMGAIALLTIGGVASLLLPRWWRVGPKSRIWLIAGLVGCLGALYLQWRTPQPQATDISQLITANPEAAQLQAIEVTGQIDTSPRLTQSQRIQFELNADRVRLESNGQTVTGKIYVTVPLLQGTGLYPGQSVRVTGSLYKPKPATNPGGFDFAKYLAQQGIFSGLNGKTVDWMGAYQPPLLWSIRHRIIQAQVMSLGVPEGPVVSAMVMGGKEVDVPHIVRDQFRVAGLAHALAASGAQVSMLLGVMLALTQRWSSRWRMGGGSIVLLLYLGLTGLEPAVLRAGVMGFVALFALVAERKVNPLGSILFAATVLLLLNPLWIFDLGFQLSFLATLGLLVTVPALTRWLDWMPSAIAPLFAVPIAAYLWTLPLQLLVFSIISPYSVGINLLTSPLIAIISIGGMISALVALIYPPFGSHLAGLLYYPTHGFIKLAEWGSQLPGSSFAVGTITLVQVLLLYGLIGLVWWWRRSHRYWWLAGLAGVLFVVMPAWYSTTHLLRVTAFATPGDPVFVLQAKGKTALVNIGDETEARFTVLPFLTQQGVNHLEWAIAPHLQATNLAGWQRLLNHLPIHTFYTNANRANAEEIAIPETGVQLTSTPPDRPSFTYGYQTLLHQLQTQQGRSFPLLAEQSIQLGEETANVLSPAPLVLQLQVGDQTWLLLNDVPPIAQQSATLADRLPQAQIIGWSGKELSPVWLEAIQPQVAIATAASLPPATNQWFQSHGVSVYLTQQTGAVQWTPQQGFQTMVESVYEASTTPLSTES